jgi:hypothetical protein
MIVIEDSVDEAEHPPIAAQKSQTITRKQPETGKEEEETIISEHSNDDDDDESESCIIDKEEDPEPGPCWLDKERVSEEDISWNRSVRIDSAVSGAMQSQRQPVLFAVKSMGQSSNNIVEPVRYYAWWPPSVRLGRDVLKTLYLMRACPRYHQESVDERTDTVVTTPQQHRNIVFALLCVLCPRYSLDKVRKHRGSVRNDAFFLLKQYFGTATHLGRLSHVYWYEDEEHGNDSICADSLDDTLALFQWEI